MPRSSRGRPEIHQAHRLQPMRLDLVRGANALGLPADFRLQAREPDLPVAAVSLALPALLLGNAGKEKLVGIELRSRLVDTFALLLQQVRKRARLALSALGELNLDRCEAFTGDPFERGQQVGDV